MIEEKIGKADNEGRTDVNGMQSDKSFHIAKSDIAGRLKYIAAPLAFAAGAYFTPEIKERYSRLPVETKQRYRTLFFAGAAILGTVTAGASGYKLYADNKRRKENVSVNDAVQ